MSIFNICLDIAIIACNVAIIVLIAWRWKK